MMRSLLLATTVLIMSVCAMAQNEHIHIFRNDKLFNYYKGSDIQSIEYVGASEGFNQMQITGTDGNTTLIPVSAIDSVQVKTTGLPVIHVNLIDHPEWTDLQGLKTDIHPATLWIEGNGMMDDLAEQTVEFRGRGHSTWNMPKKPYRFKMTKKVSLSGMKKAKSYALIANHIDDTLMHNTVSLWVARYLGMPFTNHSVPVRVYLNGDLKGAYMLTEKIGIGGGSVDIDEYTGILFELNSAYDENLHFDYTNYGGGVKRLPVEVKDPDFTEICDALKTTPEEYLNLWKADFTKMADAVVNQSEDLTNFLDLESAVNYAIVYSLAGNHEIAHPKSVYIYKPDREAGTKYQFGPVWDFDWAFTFAMGERADPNLPLAFKDGDASGASFFKKLFSNPAFRTLYKERWDAFIAEGYPELLKFMEEYASTIEPSAIENGLIWEGKGKYNSKSSFEFRKNFEELKQWIADRIEYCNNHINFGLY